MFLPFVSDPGTWSLVVPAEAHLESSVKTLYPLVVYGCFPGRPVFKVLIPDVFLQIECEGNVSLATQRLHELRAAVKAVGSGELLMGGGWQNPSSPATGASSTPRPHPHGFMVYNQTEVCYGGMAWYGMVWYGMVWYGMLCYGGMVWYGMVYYGMVW